MTSDEPPTANHSSHSFLTGQTYGWNEILNGSDSVAGPVFYLLHRRGTEIVTAVCLDIAVNPRAPYEVIPSNGPQIRLWADRLAGQTTPVHVFVKELDGLWYYRGEFRVSGETSSPKELSLRGAQAHRNDIYKIIYLAETNR